jgi:hypothetical protein
MSRYHNTWYPAFDADGLVLADQLAGDLVLVLRSTKTFT